MRRALSPCPARRHTAADRAARPARLRHRQNEPDAASTARSRAGERGAAPALEPARARRRARAVVARRLPRQGRGRSTSGPRGAARAGTSRRCSSAGTSGSAPRGGDGARRRHARHDSRRAGLHRRVQAHLPAAARPGRRTRLETSASCGYPETFVIDRQGRIAALAARPGRREFMREHGGAAPEGARRARCCWRSLLALALRPRRRSRRTARRPRSATSRTRSCARSAACRSDVASEAPQAQRERAFIQRLIDQCKSKEQIKTALVAEFGDRGARRCPTTQGDDASATCWCYVVPRRGSCWRRGGIAFAVAPLAAPRDRGRRRPPARRRATPPASTTTWSATTCDRRPGDGRHNRLRRLRASASCRSSRPACCRSCPATCRRSRASRSPSSRRAQARAKVLGPALIFCLSFTACSSRSG